MGLTALSCVFADELSTLSRAYAVVGETSAADNPNDLSENGLTVSMAAVASALGRTMPRYGISDPSTVDFADPLASLEPAPSEVPVETLQLFIAGEGGSIEELTLWASGYVGIFLLPIILFILSCLCCSCWCLFRGVLGLCGGKDPKDEGYTPAERSCPLITIGLVSILILFAAIVGFLNQAPISGGIAGGVDSLASAAEFPVELASEVQGVLADAVATIDTALVDVVDVVDAFNETLLAIENIATSLDNIVLDMEDIDNDFANLKNVSQVDGLADTITEFRDLLAVAGDQAEVAANATTEINSQIAEATNATLIIDQLRPVIDGFIDTGNETINGFTDSFNSILSPVSDGIDGIRSVVTDFDSYRLQGLQAAYGIVMLAIVFAGLGAACGKGFPFTLAQVLGWVSLFIACLILMVHLPIGTVLVDGCGAIPPIVNSIATDTESALPGFSAELDVIAIVDSCRAETPLVDIFELDPDTLFNFTELAQSFAPPTNLSGTIDLGDTDEQLNNLTTLSVANITANLDASDFVNTTFLDECLTTTNGVAAGYGQYFVKGNLSLLFDNDLIGAYSAPDNNTLFNIPIFTCIPLNEARLEVDILIDELTTNLTNIETKLFGVRTDVGFIIGNVTEISDTLDSRVAAAIASFVDFANGVVDELLVVAGALTCDGPLVIVDTLSSIVCDTMGVGFSSTAGSALVIIFFMPFFLWATIVLSKRIDNPELSEEETIGLDFAETF